MVDLPTPLAALRKYLDFAVQLQHFEKSLKSLVQGSGSRYESFVQMISWDEFKDLAHKIDKEVSKSETMGTSEIVDTSNSLLTENAITMAIDGVDRSKDIDYNLPLVSIGLHHYKLREHLIEDAVKKYLDGIDFDFESVDICHRLRCDIQYPANFPRPVILIKATPQTDRWREIKIALEALTGEKFGGMSIEFSQDQIDSLSADTSSGIDTSMTNLNLTNAPSQHGMRLRDSQKMAIDQVDRSKDVEYNLPLQTAGLRDNGPLVKKAFIMEAATTKYLDALDFDWSTVDVCQRFRGGVQYPPNLSRPVILIMSKPRTKRWPEIKEALEAFSLANFDGLSVEMQENAMIAW